LSEILPGAGHQSGARSGRPASVQRNLPPMPRMSYARRLPSGSRIACPIEALPKRCIRISRAWLES
jgi:hypothetical protein